MAIVTEGQKIKFRLCQAKSNPIAKKNIKDWEGAKKNPSFTPPLCMARC